MRKVIVSNLVSLDGYFEGPNKELDWFTVEEEFFDYAKEMFTTVDTIIFGRVTYQMMESYWPNNTDDDPIITNKMNTLPKIVFSTTLEKAKWGKWNNARLIKENIAEEVTKMKQERGKDMVIFGSGKLVSSFTQLGLIDEYRIILNPVILGNGNLLFKGIEERISLTLQKSKTLSSGVIILYYKRKQKA